MNADTLRKIVLPALCIVGVFACVLTHNAELASVPGTLGILLAMFNEKVSL